MSDTKENRKKWIEALRSGKYKQAKGCLKRESLDAYCCLGVLCEISGLSYIPAHPYAPLEVIKWGGLSNGSGTYYEGGVLATLAELNDSKSCSFDKIADVIESEPDGLFVD